MILNISGRTDIPAFYSEWFMNRIKDGYVDVRNPFNYHAVSRIYFDNVDLLFFCTKNPIPMLDYIDKIDKKIYFHVTLTPYKKNIEPNVCDKKELIEGIKKLSNKIGKDNLVIRYDPIFINDEYNVDYHIKAFSKICELLDGYVEKILIHFINDYKNVRKNYNVLKYRKPTNDEYEKIGKNFSLSASKHNIKLFTCSEDIKFLEFDFINDECISEELAFKLTGKVYKTKWSKTRDVKCNCIQMVDIGDYNCCKHFCKYCYANYDEAKVMENVKKHNPKSSLLIGELEKEDVIKERIK